MPKRPARPARTARRAGGAPILVVGSVAFDDVKTPAGAVTSAVGGAATYFSVAATVLHRPVRLVGIVGRDFPEPTIDLLRRRGVETDGLVRTSGETFHWSGRYEGTMDEAVTERTCLNVFADFRPSIPPAWRETPYVFLANIDPDLQTSVLAQVRRPRLVAMDTMNFWITSKPKALRKVLAQVDLVVMNDAEARAFTGETNLIAAARALLAMGPRAAALKKGSHGCLLASGRRLAVIPAYPVERVIDPTGAGDSFGGGMMASLAAAGADHRDWKALRLAAARGAVIASFDVEGFSFEGTRRASPAAVERRLRVLREISSF